MKDVATFFINAHMDNAELHPAGPGHVAVFTCSHPFKKTANEDSAAFYVLDNETVVLAVADGLGGNRDGDAASRIALEALGQSLKEHTGDGSVRSAILDGMEKANRKIIQLGTGAATTLSVLEINGDIARPYHVGDSLILTCGQRGKLKMFTVPHSPVGFAMEAGIIDEEEAMHHEFRHIVSNVIGTLEMKIEVGSPITLSKFDTVIIASDGLADNLSVTEIIDIIRKGSLETVGDRLALKTQQRMLQPYSGEPSKPDDLSFIAYRNRALPKHN